MLYELNIMLILTVTCMMAHSISTGHNAPINVMPHYHIYGLRWGKVGICTLGKYKSQPTGATMLV